jgi:ComF family protein
VIGANDSFCPECSGKLVPYNDDFSVAGSSGFTAAYEYRPEISAGIIIMKRGIVGNAPFAFGGALVERIREAGFEADIIVPVPMFRNDLQKRGVNQSELIAKELSLRLGIPVCRNAVRKVRSTTQQKGLSRQERLVNLRGAFAVNAPLIAGKSVIVADDVCTTGSTLAEMTDILLKAGAKKVYCACCCKTPRKDSNNSPASAK